MEPISRSAAAGIWRNGRVPVIYKPENRGRLMVRVPFATDNRDWLLGNGRLIEWYGRFRAWGIPCGRFDDIVQRSLDRYDGAYLIQAFRPLQKCAPACWNAYGYDCECSCLGENHGTGRALEHEVSETFAFEWGERQLACRLLTRLTA